MDSIVPLIVGLLVGGIAGWFAAAHRLAASATGRREEAERRAATAEGRLAELQERLRSFETEARRLTEEAASERAALRERLAAEEQARARAEVRATETEKRLEAEKRLLDEAKARLTETFKALAGDTLKDSGKQFLALAQGTLEKLLAEARGDLGRREASIDGLVKPLAEGLRGFDAYMRSIENQRKEDVGRLEKQLAGLTQAQASLERETTTLSSALRSPQVRGRWGELTLKRVVELAGMSEHCDFETQVSVATEEGRLRPDMIVRLAGDREVVVDAKVPLEAYLAAISAEEGARRELLKEHAARLRDHMRQLSSKEYWSRFRKAPDFVVMFIPGESFFAAAAEIDRTLIEDGLAQRVILATPTTLIALLHAVAYGWRQEQMAANAERISELGRTLFERMEVLAGYLGEIGGGLEKAVQSYNKSVSSIETRLLPAARRFKELGVTDRELEPLEPLAMSPRRLESSPPPE